MDEFWDEFGRIVEAVLIRCARQASRSIPPRADLLKFVTQLRGLIEERGLPRALAEDEVGTPGSLSETETAPLVARVVAGLNDPWFTDIARQFVKTCFYPEFKVCRDSFREVGRDGLCRRQELERVRGRISGAHCIDCPHWIALTPDEHEQLMVREWRTDAQCFLAHQEEFLPEDFRALRRWLRVAARRGLPRST